MQVRPLPGVPEYIMEQTIKCPICGEPYVAYGHYAGDQSACSDCRMKASRNRGQWKTDQSFEDFQIGYPINRKKRITNSVIDNYYSPSVTEIIDPQLLK